MIETGLVYIYSCLPTRDFVGCGALVEGGYIATCRHVWRDAIACGENGEPPEVEIMFPFVREKGISTSLATLADICEEAEGVAPDLVLLKPETIPSGVMTLQLATKERFETGAGRAHTFLASRNHYSTVDGRIDAEVGPDALRQFRSDQPQQYFFEKGSSGSPVFLDNAQQLAGIIALSELGANAGESHLREAFVVPATTIRAYLVRLQARPVAEKQAINPADLQPILDRLGAQDVAVSDIPARLIAFVDEAQRQAAKPVPVSNDGADIDAAIAASRAKLRGLDTAGALDVLQAKIADEEQERGRRLVSLLKERATVERLAFDYDAAKETLAEVIRLAPDDVLAFIDLGDIYVTTGALEEAAKAYQGAGEAAQRRGDERARAAAFNRLGDVQAAQFDPKGALKSYSDSLAIIERLAKSGPGNGNGSAISRCPTM
jgi:tetratricopeptide (TPR) repeat protein